VNNRYDFYFYQKPIFRYVNCFNRNFRLALQPYIYDVERKYYRRIGHRFPVYSEIYFHPKPSINISAVSPSQILISFVTILYVQSRDLSRDELKRLYDQRKANILSNFPLLEDCRSFDAGLWLLHEQQNPILVFMLILVSHLNPVETAIMGYFLGGSIANIV